MTALNKGVKTIIRNVRQLKKLPVLSVIEKEKLEAELRLDATYFSNKLEGNELDKKGTREAIFMK